MRATAFPLASALVLMACGQPDSGDAPVAEEPIALYDGLGDLHRPITTDVPEAQAFFDQGLRLTYAFNHAEAIQSYEEALRLDPSCALCSWGSALAWGPNINAAMDSASGAAAWAAITQAEMRATGASEKEQAFIRALGQRYAADPTADRARLDSAYARAMGELARLHPDDDDALVLYADALMNLSPWDYWTRAGQPKPATREILTLLERVIGRSPSHPGACHFYIHAVEAVQPERAVDCAERLPSLMPAAGHIVHMPAHIFVRVGRYADAVRANEHAVHADEEHLADFAPDGAYRLAYYPHNYHFMWFAASMAGSGARALEAARSTAANVNHELLRAPGFGALQHYLVTPQYALVRFGRWQEILAGPAPPEDLPYPMGVHHYARALAFVGLDRLPEAELELAALEQQRAALRAVDFRIWELNPASTNLVVAIHVVRAEIAAKKGDHAAAIEHARQGVVLEDAMLYDEPPTWHLPVRHTLGALLLAAGRSADAEAVYRQDLAKYPENGWSLFGLGESLRAQDRAADADAIMDRFRAAWSAGDAELRASRF
jgi:tetratricopeptide (TPR) repeat protein